MLERLKHYLCRRSRPVAFADAERLEPVSRTFGVERGTPVDRYYIENFLRTRSDLLRGDAVEIADTAYLRAFGSRTVSATALTFEPDRPGTLFGDLTRPETLPVARFDSMICTQTLNFVRDPAAAAVRFALDGLAVEDLPNPAVLDSVDSDYPLVVVFAARLRR